jgi:hypothetical protein
MASGGRRTDVALAAASNTEEMQHHHGDIETGWRLSADLSERRDSG